MERPVDKRRRGFISVAAAASAGWLSSPLWRAVPGARQAESAALSDRVSRVIEAYDSQGLHRTGTDVDDRSAAWLLEEARAAGAGGALAPFSLNRVNLHACVLQAGDRRIEGLPLFDGTFTGAAGVAGRLGAAGTDAEIALVELDAAAISSEGRSISALRRSARHTAIVAVTRGARPGLCPMNAADFAEPYGVPVLQVSSTEGEWLRDLADRRAGVTCVAYAGRIADTASNVVATVGGSRPELPPVVVMTPRSGWWSCASERGGGLACWIEAIRAVAGAGAPRTVHFAASSGHELGHRGLDSYIAARPALVKAAAAWLHLGANIGAAGGRMRLQASDDGIEQAAAAALTGAGAPVESRVPRGTVPAGEARDIHLGGGRYVSLLGSSPYFHNPADRWPATVDAPAVARYAAAMAALAVALAREA